MSRAEIFRSQANTSARVSEALPSPVRRGRSLPRRTCEQTLGEKSALDATLYHLPALARRTFTAQTWTKPQLLHTGFSGMTNGREGLAKPVHAQRASGHMLSDRELAQALNQGDPGAMAQLYDRYGRVVYGLALRITRDQTTAEEVCLDAFLRLWQERHRFDSKLGELRPWLLTIARNLALDRVRSVHAAKRTEAPGYWPPPDPPDTPDEIASMAERKSLVQKALERLAPPQRTALELAFYEGLSHAEIAQRLAEPLGTVKSRIRQAMSILRETLRPYVGSQR